MCSPHSKLIMTDEYLCSDFWFQLNVLNLRKTWNFRNSLLQSIDSRTSFFDIWVVHTYLLVTTTNEIDQ